MSHVLSRKERQLFFSDVIFMMLVGLGMNILIFSYNTFAKVALPLEALNAISAFISITLLFQLIVGGVQLEVSRFISKNKKSNLKESFESFLKLGIITTGVLVVLLMIASPLIAKVVHVDSRYLVLSSLSLLFLFIKAVYCGVLFGFQRARLVIFINLVENLLKLLLIFITISITKTVFIVILASILPTAVIAIILFFTVKIPDNAESRIVKFQPNGFTSTVSVFILINFPLILDVLYIKPEFRPEYSILNDVTRVLLFTSMLFLDAAFIKMAATKSQNKRNNYLQMSLTITLTILFIVFLIVQSYSSQITLAIYGHKFNHLDQFLIYSVLMAILFAITYALNYYLISMRHYLIKFLVFINLAQFFTLGFFVKSVGQIVAAQILIFSFSAIICCFYVIIINRRLHIERN